MEGKKYFSGKLDKNVAFGLSWLIWPVAIIEMILDKDVLDVEEKRDLVSLFVILVLGTVLAATLLLSPLAGLLGILVIVKAIMTFMGKEFKIPGAYQIAAKIIK